MRGTLVAPVAFVTLLAVAQPAGWEHEPARSQAVAPVPGAVVEDFAPPEERWGTGNRGLKLSAGAGDPVVAALPGTVSFAGEVAGQGWVTVDHGGGLATTYGALDAAVVPGARVGVGQVVGHLEASAEHLHWGARLRGGYIDPASLLEGWTIRLVPLGHEPDRLGSGARVS